MYCRHANQTALGCEGLVYSIRDSKIAGLQWSSQLQIAGTAGMQTSGSREPRYFERCRLFSYKLLAQGVVRCPSSLLHTGSTYFRGASRTSWYKDRGFNRLSERVIWGSTGVRKRSGAEATDACSCPIMRHINCTGEGWSEPFFSFTPLICF